MSLPSTQDDSLRRYCFPWTLDASRWKVVVQVLASTVVQSTSDLAHLIGTVRGLSTEPKDYDNLFTAIAELDADLDGFDFFHRLLPQIQRDVVSAPAILGASCAVLSQEQGDCKVQFTHQQAYRVACLAFFGLCHPLSDQSRDPRMKALASDHFGHLDWSVVYAAGSNRGEVAVAVARVKCQLAYLHSIASLERPENETFLTFYRTVLGPKESLSRWAEPHWTASAIPLSDLKVTISTNARIEDVQADAHLDFANKYLHIGTIIPSATQEEVLFSIRPECFVGLLFSEVMRHDDAIVITGARRFSNYYGYLQTFRFTGLYQDKTDYSTPPAIIAIDSLVNSVDNNQFQAKRMARDMNKAYLGFKGVGASNLTFQSISTGQWGCGAFFGDPVLKFLQQVLAAAQAGVAELYYSAFHREALAEKTKHILAGLQKRGVTVGELYKFLVSLEAGGAGRDDIMVRFHREMEMLAGLD